MDRLFGTLAPANRVDRDGRKAYEFEGEVVDLEDIQRKEGNRPLILGLSR